MLGLMTAEALSHHSSKVIVIERSKRPDGKSIAAHGNQVHTVLTRGCQIIEKLFPGICDEIIASGGVFRDMGTSFKWWSYGGWRVKMEEG